MSNVFKTAILLAALTAMVVLPGGAVGGRQGMLVASVLAVVNPLNGQALTRLFSTHPPVEERIARPRVMRV